MLQTWYVSIFVIELRTNINEIVQSVVFGPTLIRERESNPAALLKDMKFQYGVIKDFIGTFDRGTSISDLILISFNADYNERLFA